MKKIISVFTALFTILVLASCGSNKLFDVEPEGIDHYYSNKLSFADTNTVVDGNNFVANKIGFVTLKSVTDGDTAVFHLPNKEVDLSPTGNNHAYLTVRFLGIDTPESTSSIQPWGKKASSYVRGLLENAKGIILDATDIDTTGVENNGIKSGYRLDSNGTRWLALVWYTNDSDINDLTKYRLLQLDVIEECYSRFTVFSSERYVYEATKKEEPILNKKYADQFGSLKLSELLFEAEYRMSITKLRKFGSSLDDGYDYSKTPTQLPSIKDVYDNFDSYSTLGTFVAVTGVIVRFVGPNFYIADEDGYGLYIYMGIDGNGIEGEGNSQFQAGDTINIRGRICEYGGQVQMSGIEFKASTFVKITDEDEKIAMPEAVKVTGSETIAELDALVGRLVYAENFQVTKIGSTSKDLSYSLTTSMVVSELQSAGSNYPNIQIRINGSLNNPYNYDYVNENKGNIAKVTGIMSIYKEMDVQLENNFPSYQIVLGNVMVDSSSELVFKE